MIVQLIKEKCEDTMADEEFSYIVSVDIKLSKDKDYQTFKGCGNYVPDYRLHNIWIVKQVNGKIINEEDFDRKIPQLEIKPFENKISGNDGCNGFFGEIEVINDIIVFGNIAGTMMACPNMDLSSQITKTIGGNKLRYTIRNDMLIFNEKEKEVMVLKRVD
jgi:heat shock protein HslJ